MLLRDRADTPEKKRAVIESLYEAWLTVPEWRLGQLLSNTLQTRTVEIANYPQSEEQKLGFDTLHVFDTIFYLEDTKLIWQIQDKLKEMGYGATDEGDTRQA